VLERGAVEHSGVVGQYVQATPVQVCLDRVDEVVDRGGVTEASLTTCSSPAAVVDLLDHCLGIGLVAGVVDEYVHAVRGKAEGRCPAAAACCARDPRRPAGR